MTDGLEIVKPAVPADRVELPQTWTTVRYKCAQCGAEDSDGVLEGKAPTPALNCHACGAGSKLDIHSQVLQKKGMLLVTEEAA